jgi:hypothetical protein
MISSRRARSSHDWTRLEEKIAKLPASFVVPGDAATSKLQWETFDVAAFEEALKALHQVEEKGKERAKELARKQARHDYQRGKSKKRDRGLVISPMIRLR